MAGGADSGPPTVLQAFQAVDVVLSAALKSGDTTA